MPSPREVALEHYADRQSLVDATGEVAGQMWAEVDPRRIVDSWAERLPEMTAVVTGAQLGAARQADRYVTTALEADDVDPASESPVSPAGFSGSASDGRSLLTLLTNPVFVTLATIADGIDVARALGAGRSNLDMLVRTQVADAGRMADQVAITARPHARGYVRVAVGNSCARCLLLAGKEYLWNAGFQRHPRCDCIHLPAGVAKAGRLVQDPRRIYDRMTQTERTRAGFTRGDQLALARGADLGQVVNARRGLYTAGGREFTTEGTTRRGFARARLGKGSPRLTPDQIFIEAGDDRDEALRLLHRHGYLLEPPTRALASPSGRQAAVTVAPTTVRPVLAAAKSTRDLQAAIRAEFQRIAGRDVMVQVPVDASLATWREFAEGLFRGLEQFPDAQVRTIAWFRQQGTHYAQAANREIAFNAWWSSTENRARLLRATRGDVADWPAGRNGWMTRGAGNPAAIAIHELGHILDIDNLADAIHPQVMRIVNLRAASARMDAEAFVAREISTYATSDTRELVAEAFTDVMLRGSAASPLARDVFDLLQAEYRKGGFATAARAGTPAPAAPAAGGLNALKVAELKDLATQRGIAVPAKATKSQLVDLLAGPAAGSARAAGVARRSDAALLAAPDATSRRAARQAEIDAARAYSDLARRIDEVVENAGSTRALVHAINSAGRQGRIATTDLTRLLDTVTSPTELRTLARSMAGREGVDLIDLSGTRMPFDRARHEPIGADIPDGAPVIVVRPGATLHLGDEVIELDRAGVRVDLDAPPAGPRPSTGLTQTPILKMNAAQLRAYATEHGLTVPAGTSSADLRRMVLRHDEVSFRLERAAQQQRDLVADLAGKEPSARAVAAKMRGVLKPLRLEPVDAAGDLLRGSDGRAVAYLWRRPDGDVRLDGPVPAGWSDIERIEFDAARRMARVALGAEDAAYAGRPLTVPAAGAVEDAAARAAQVRQARIDEARKVSAVLAELDELASNGASKAALLERLDTAATRLGTPATVVTALRKAIAGTPAALRKAIVTQARRVDLDPIDAAGAITRFDPTVHQAAPGSSLKAGDVIAVVRPGHTLKLGDEAIQLDKAVVQAWSRDDALAAARRVLEGKPTAAALTKAGITKTAAPSTRAVAYDPAKHELPPGVTLAKGAKVRVTAPGYATQYGGKTLVVRKASVRVDAPTPPARGGRTAPTLDQIARRGSSPEWRQLSNDDWERAAKELSGMAQRVVRGDFGGVRAVIEPDGISVAGNGQSFGFWGELLDTKTGRKIGDFDRSFYRDREGNWVATHVELTIDRRHQGSGIAEQFNQNLFDWYRRSGVKRVELTANIDVGGYAWATKGFDFVDAIAAQEFVSTARGKVRAALRKKNPPKGLTREQLDELAEYLERVDTGAVPARAFDISQFGRQPGQGGKAAVWPGKWLMLGRDISWDGAMTV